MNGFGPYVTNLETLVRSVLQDPSIITQASLEQVLDGQPRMALRGLVSLSEIRQSGAFFTPQATANMLASGLHSNLQAGEVVCDPACGAGDLLLACAQYLPVLHSLDSTLLGWGRQLIGYDLHEEFVRATKVRLAILAVSKGAVPGDSEPDLDSLFPHIKVANGLDVTGNRPTPSCLIMNPPFTIVTTPQGYLKASGKISQAALFIERYVRTSPVGTKIVAILPDVLRTGSNYSKWRSFVRAHCRISDVRSIGVFDSLTEVDVFSVTLTIGEGDRSLSTDWWPSVVPQSVSQTVDDYFYVNVGRVVPHRDVEEGEEYAYLDVHSAPAWQTVQAGKKTRRYNGTVMQPPFVVVRRTSRSNDRFRAVGTIITGERLTAVENHLLVLRPKSNALSMCEQLLTVLKSDLTNEWFNQRMRCRHLTVSSLKELPWPINLE